MAEQLYYEDIAIGHRITPVVKQPTTRQLVMWAGAVGDYSPIHYDKGIAQDSGLPGVIVHGDLMGSFLSQFLTDWIGEQGVLRELGCSYRKISLPGEAITCGGEVTRKYVKDGEHCIECSLWIDNPERGKVVSGVATVILPSRGGAVQV